jgi:hypothetical protein
MNTVPFRKIRSLLFIAVLSAHAAAATGAVPAPALKADTSVATAGFYRLVWGDAGGGLPTYELQESADGAFNAPRAVYTGRDQASVLSGQPDGEYHYRVRARLEGGESTDWSAIATVRVSHHPLSRAFGFFAAGAVVFLATLGLIVAGNRRAEGE